MLRAIRAKPRRPEPFLVHFQRLQEKVYVFALQVFCFVLCVSYFKPLLRYLQLGSVDVQRHMQASLQLFMLPFVRKPVLTHFQFTALFLIILAVGNECEKFLLARTLKTA